MNVEGLGNDNPVRITILMIYDIHSHPGTPSHVMTRQISSYSPYLSDRSPKCRSGARLKRLGRPEHHGGPQE
eukprot:5842797-Pleurochrysis_carterae.AAC.1